MSRVILKKINYKLLFFSLLALCLFSVGTFTFLKQIVYGQTANAWNIQRVTGSNNLNFFYSTSGYPTVLSLNNTGNLRMETTTPGATYALHMYTSAGNTHEMIKFETAGPGLPGSSYIGHTRSGYNNLLLIGHGNYAEGTIGAININSSNNVGIGTLTPSQKLHVSGNMLVSGELINTSFPALGANNQLCRETSTGRLGSCSSDKRLKENISPLNISALNLVLKLKPSTFNFKNSSKSQTGFIAQEVLEILPEAVTKSSDGYYGLNDSAFTPYLVKAIQELNTKNLSLEHQLNSQQQEIDLLKQEINNLKSSNND